MDLRPHIEKFRQRFAEVESLLSAPETFAQPQRAQELGREYARLKELVATGSAYLKVANELAGNRELLQSGDAEMAALAKEEIARLEPEETRLGKQVHFGLVPPDSSDSRNTIIEIRAGAGGSESCSRAIARRAVGRPRRSTQIPPTSAASRKSFLKSPGRTFSSG